MILLQKKIFSTSGTRVLVILLIFAPETKAIDRTVCFFSEIELKVKNRWW